MSMCTAFTFLGKTANTIQQTEEYTVESLAEYREYNRYDDTILWSQDVISAILQYRGQPALKVSYKTGSTVTYNLNTVKDRYTNQYLSTQFNVSAKFHSYKQLDASGTVVQLNFVEVS